MSSKRSIVVLMFASIATVVVSVCFYLYSHDYGSYFHGTKGNLVESKTSIFKKDADFNREWLFLKSDSGLDVECGLLVPEQGKGNPPYPAVVLLGGMATGRHAIDYVTGMSGVVIAAPDYPIRERLSGAGRFLADLPRMRRAGLQSISEVMLLMDYLSRRPDVDPSKIILVGYSFGSPFVPCVAAYDKRAAVVVMVFGGGDVSRMLQQNVRSFAGRVGGKVIGVVGEAFLWPVEPLRYAERITPTPLLMINGTRDQRIPRECVMEFFRRAKEPKKLIWLDARHVNPDNPMLTAEIVRTLERELARMGILATPSPPLPSP